MPVSRRKEWSGRRDLNRGPPAPKAGALPGCATPRHEVPCNYRALLIFLTPQSPSRAAAPMLRLSHKSDGQPADFLATFRGQIQRTEANAKLLEKSWCPRIVCVKLPTLLAQGTFVMVFESNTNLRSRSVCGGPCDSFCGRSGLN